MSAQLNLRHVNPVFNKLQPNPKAPNQDRFEAVQARFKKSRDTTQLGQRRAISNREFKASVANTTVAYFRPNLWGIPNALGGKITLTLPGMRVLTRDLEEEMQKALVPKDKISDDLLEAEVNKVLTATYTDAKLQVLQSQVLSFIKVYKGTVKELDNITLGTSADALDDDKTTAREASRSSDVANANIEELQSLIAVSRDKDPSAYEAAQTLLALKLYESDPVLGMSYYPISSIVAEVHVRATLGELDDSVTQICRDYLDKIVRASDTTCTLGIQLGFAHNVKDDSISPNGLVQSRERQNGDGWISDEDNVAHPEGANNRFGAKFAYLGGRAVARASAAPGSDGEGETLSDIDDDSPQGKPTPASAAGSAGLKTEGMSPGEIARANLASMAGTSTPSRGVAFMGMAGKGVSTIVGGNLRKGRGQLAPARAAGSYPFEALAPEYHEMEVLDNADWINAVWDGEYNTGDFPALENAFNWVDLELEIFERETKGALLEFALGAANTIGINIDDADTKTLAHFILMRGFALRFHLGDGKGGLEFETDRWENFGAVPFETEAECFKQLTCGLMGPVGAMTCLHGFKKSGHYVTANALANTAYRLYAAVKAESDDELDFDPNRWALFLGSSLYPAFHFADLRIVEVFFRKQMKENDLSFAYGRRIFPNGPGNVGPFLLSKVLGALKEARFFELMGKEEMFQSFIGAYKAWERDCWKELPYSNFFYGESRPESVGFKNFMAAYGHYAYALDSIMPSSSFKFSVALAKASSEAAANSIIANLEVKAFVAAYRGYVAAMVTGRLQKDTGRGGVPLLTM